MSRHSIAVGMIDARFDCLRAGQTSEGLFRETSMAFEMAYALGAINDSEYSSYKGRFDRFYQVRAESFVNDVRRTFP